jgi:hypothetical protein
MYEAYYVSFKVDVEISSKDLKLLEDGEISLKDVMEGYDYNIWVDHVTDN